jgi:uncharacterized peroxidase-related enzyme
VSWTRSIPVAEAGPDLAALYERIRMRSSHGRVSNLWLALGSVPPTLDAVDTLHRALIVEPAPLTRPQAELIAVVVSATNGCGYCVAHHGPALERALANPALARAVAVDYRAADLAARDRVLLDHCVALTCEPGERTRADIERIREYGFDDAGIAKATAIAAYYNMVNRLVSVLGVELEPDVPVWEFGTQV